jgi:prophage regulatory protein
VERADHSEPSRRAGTSRKARRQRSSERIETHDGPASAAVVNDRKLLDKWEIEEMTSLDITTIYRKIKAGSFPQPVRVGRRRVAWRESDIAARLAATRELVSERPSGPTSRTAAQTPHPPKTHQTVHPPHAD